MSRIRFSRHTATTRNKMLFIIVALIVQIVYSKIHMTRNEFVFSVIIQENNQNNQCVYYIYNNSTVLRECFINLGYPVIVASKTVLLTQGNYAKCNVYLVHDDALQQMEKYFANDALFTKIFVLEESNATKNFVKSLPLEVIAITGFNSSENLFNFKVRIAPILV